MDHAMQSRPDRYRPKRRDAYRIGVALAAFAVMTGPVHGQDAGTTLSGMVVTASNHPVPGATVRLVGNDSYVVTGEDGLFAIGPIGFGEHVLVIEKDGYDPRGFRFTLDDASIRDMRFGAVALTRRITSLPGIVVESKPDNPRLNGFYQRRARGIGLFFTRQEIRERNPSRLSDLFRSVPGFTVDCSGAGCLPRLSRLSGARSLRGDIGRCEVEYYLDGVPDRFFIDLDLFHPNQVEGIEIYRGPSETPSAFARSGGHCGVIAIWTV